MAVPSYVFTIRRVAKLLGEDEELLGHIATDMMEQGDGCLPVSDVDDVSTVVFTAQGIEYLTELPANLNR
jgi:hypothetical protein